VLAVLLAISVNVLLAVAGFGLKEGVTPGGRLEADKLTLDVKPVDGVMVIVVVPELPRAMLKLLGDAESVKSPTTRATVVVWTIAPLVAVTVMVKLPVGVEPAVDTVIVEEPEVITEAGLKLAVAPAGSPLALKLTVPVNPFTALTVAV
jgi:hypothetical protein